MARANEPPTVLIYDEGIVANRFSGQAELPLAQYRLSVAGISDVLEDGIV